MKKSTKQWKKILTALALAVMTPLLASAVVLTMDSMALTAQAATSGNFKTTDKKGNVLAWSYDDGTKTLTISGKGPWGDGIETETGIELYGLKKIVFSEGCAVSGSMEGAFAASSYDADMDTYKTTLEEIDLLKLDTSQVTNMSEMFYGCNNLTSLNLSGFDTSNVKYMEGMFYCCWGLTSLDLSGFNTSNVADMSRLFSYCYNLTSLDMSGFDTSNVTNMFGMFDECGGLTSLDVSGFDTSNVTDMGIMFQGCSGLTSLDVSGFDTNNVKSMEGMFNFCSDLTNLDVSGFDMRQVAYMSYMFDFCSSLNSICTPKALPEGASISLPDVFCSSTGAETESITTDFLSTVLTRKGVTPTPTQTPTTPVPTEAPTTPAPTQTPVPTETPATPAPTQAPSPTQAPVSPETGAQVQNFATRMYTKALGRDADEAGLNDWTNRLLTHEIDGAGIAFGFIMSPEFGDRDLSDNDYVETLYQTFFNRDSDEGGKATWMGELAAGKPRSSVLAGFVNSQEFDNLCESFGIVRGIMREDGSVVNPGIRQFVERCYTKVLGRAGEKEGLENWTNAILQGAQTPEEVAKNFFFSQEYTNKNTADDVFVETLYQTFMDRDSDSQGKQNWLDALAGGTSRAEVLEGFSRSEEFGKILEGFGL